MNFLFSIQSVINTLTWLMHILCDICVPYYIYIFSRWFFFLSFSLLISHRIASCAHIFMQIYYLKIAFDAEESALIEAACGWLRDKNVCRHTIAFGKKWDKRTKDIIESISIYRLACWWLLFSIGIRSRIERERKKNCMHKINMHKTDEKKNRKNQ